MHHTNPPPTFPSHPLDPNSDSDTNPGSSPHSPLQPPPTTTSATMSDVFSTTPSPPSAPTKTIHPANMDATNSEPSDIPRLRSTHATAGYRDGIAASKESTIQAGFDEGYALGATVAMRAGWVLGVLEGVRDGLVAGKQRVCGGREGREGGEGSGGGGNEGEGKEEARRVEKLLADARAELSVQGLFGERYWGADGVWRFEVVGGRDGTRGGRMEGEEGEVTFLEVAEQHPLIGKWVGVVEKEAERWGVNLGGFEGEEWERGRVGG